MRPDGRAARRAAPDHLRARLHRRRRRVGAGVVRRHAGAVHRVGRRGRASLDAGPGQGLGHRRVLDAARLVARAGPPRGEGGHAVGAHPGDPAPHRPLAAGGVRHGRAGRAPGHRRLRRAPGRRRHAHGVDLRRLPRAARRAGPAACRPAADRQPSAAPRSAPRSRSASSTACRCSTWPTSRTPAPRST